jgi:N6-L-threonylcarbamoyladenine synthase
MTAEPQLILGIESSCDETGCAVVADGRDVRAGIVASQIDQHARFGGVVPEIASRAHIEAINGVIDRALEAADVGREDLAAIAVTHEPGLIGSLLVGLVAAKTLAWAWQLPLIGVNHVNAHAWAAALDAEEIDYPAAALICSGGHTAIYQCEGPTEMTLLGRTIDDAAGEAFDKVATILQLGYPGGPAIDKAAAEGDGSKIDFPRPLIHKPNLDFSFSGIKTAVLYHVQGNPVRGQDQPRRTIEDLGRDQVLDIAASFQRAVVDVLVAKLGAAARRIQARSLILGGGVAANSELRSRAGQLADELGVPLRKPAMKYCLDNAAMIAGLGWHLWRQGKCDDYDLAARATVAR